MARALELTDAGFEVTEPALIGAYVRFADYVISDWDKKLKKPLRQQLTLVSAEAASNDEDIGAMWYALASQEMAAANYLKVDHDAEHATEKLKASGFGESREVAQAYLYRAISKIFRSQKSLSALRVAHEYIAEAANRFSPQESIEAFDKTFALILAWDAAIHAVYRSRNYRQTNEDEFSFKEDHFYVSIFSKTKSAGECELEWSSKEPPEYPKAALRSGEIGSTLIGYDLSDSGPTNVRVLAEVPQEAFADAVLKQVLEWKLAKPPVDHPDCRANFTTNVTFVIN